MKAEKNWVADGLARILSSNASTPRYVMGAGLKITLRFADLVRAVMPEGEGRIAWQEFHNKLKAFHLFKYVNSVLGLSPALHLEQMVERTHTLGPFFSVWATEGVGYYYTYLRMRNGIGSGRGQIGAPLADHAGNLPPESLVPLHVGMGLAFAEALLAHGKDCETVAGDFVELCCRASLPHYWPVAFEGLGLVVRNLYPKLIAPLDRHLSSEGGELLAYFWHGVGRGTYFAPANALRYWSEPWRGLEACMQPRRELVTCNAVSGFAWAMTLVNLRQPEVVAACLRRHGAKLAASDAFANGVFSALTVWLSCAPRDAFARAFCEYRPSAQEDLLQRLWMTCVHQPGSRALRSPSLTPDIAQVFRYQPLAEFVG